MSHPLAPHEKAKRAVASDKLVKKTKSLSLRRARAPLTPPQSPADVDRVDNESGLSGARRFKDIFQARRKKLSRKEAEKKAKELLRFAEQKRRHRMNGKEAKEVLKHADERRRMRLDAKDDAMKTGEGSDRNGWRLGRKHEEDKIAECA